MLSWKEDELLTHCNVIQPADLPSPRIITSLLRASFLLLLRNEKTHVERIKEDNGCNSTLLET